MSGVRTAPRVVLVGPPGAAVPQVGERLAELLGAAVVDTDVEVERLAGRPAGDVLVDDGEDAFRALEREAAAVALASPAVVALGGGTVEDAEVPRRPGGLPGRRGHGGVPGRDVGARGAPARVQPAPPDAAGATRGRCGRR